MDALLREPRGDFEVVVVDDASTDDTVDRMCEFADPRFRLFRNEQNVGMIANWNLCAQMSNGRWICVFHQDDMIVPGLTAHIRAASVHLPDGGIICSPGQDRFPGGQVLDRRGFPENPVKLNAGYEAMRFIMSHPLYCSTVVISKIVYDAVGYFDTTLPYTADEEFWMRAASRFPLFYFPYPAVIYRRHAGHEGTRRWWQADFATRYWQTHERCLAYLENCTDEQSMQLHSLSQRRLLDTWLTVASLALEAGEKEVALKYLHEAKKTRGRHPVALREMLLRLTALLPTFLAQGIMNSIHNFCLYVAPIWRKWLDSYKQ